MAKKEALGFQIDRKDQRDQESGDCETCRCFLPEESTCLLYQCETQSYESCSQWRNKGLSIQIPAASGGKQ